MDVDAPPVTACRCWAKELPELCGVPPDIVSFAADVQGVLTGLRAEADELREGGLLGACAEYEAWM